MSPLRTIGLLLATLVALGGPRQWCDCSPQAVLELANKLLGEGCSWVNLAALAELAQERAEEGHSTALRDGLLERMAQRVLVECAPEHLALLGEREREALRRLQPVADRLEEAEKEEAEKGKEGDPDAAFVETLAGQVWDSFEWRLASPAFWRAAVEPCRTLAASRPLPSYVHVTGAMADALRKSIGEQRWAAQLAELAPLRRALKFCTRLRQFGYLKALRDSYRLVLPGKLAEATLRARNADRRPPFVRRRRPEVAAADSAGGAL